MEATFVTSADGTRLRVVRWAGGDRDCLVVGGLAEHAGRYPHVAAALQDRGFAVHCVELRGHGKSGGRRSHVYRWSEYVDDVRAGAEGLRPGWVFLSHSMGGLVALDALLSGLAPARLALSNPLLGLKLVVPPAKAAAGRVLSRLWPTLALGNEVKGEDLSRDPEVGVRYHADPDIYHKVTGRWFTEMLDAQSRVMAGSYGVPLGFFVSDTDPVNDAAASRKLAARMGSHVQEYPGMRHEIFNEVGKEQVLADVAAWLAG
jgi:alpha-beta hydrolase superfamily lysophospholipase